MRISDWSSDVCSSDLFASRTPGTANTYAQELRLTSSNSGPFNWIAGLYFSHTDQTLGEIFQGQAFSDLLDGLFGPDDGPVGPASYIYVPQTSEPQVAGFAEVNVKATDQPAHFAGGRVYHTKNPPSPTCPQMYPRLL